MITDTHAHLFWESFKEDFDEVINRAIDNKVTTIINVGTDLQTSKEALEQVENLSLKYSSSPACRQAGEVEKLHFYSSIGIHPHDALRYTQGKQSDVEEAIQNDIEELEKIYLQNPEKVIAVGECGLDFNFNNRDFIPSDLSIEEIKDLQKLLLKAQVNLAKKLNLPLLIHTRDAWQEIFDFISDHFGILHCFSGDLEVAKKALNSNFLVSFAGNVTYPKNGYLHEVVKFLPLEKIVFETDCPFLPPHQIRGRRNEPAAIKETAELVANLKGMSLEKIAVQTSENVKKLLKI